MNQKRRQQRRVNSRTWLRRIFIAGAYAFTSFVVAVTLSWLMLAPMNFAYGIWHDHGGIAAGIARYGPENRYKPGFADTTREQRLALFAAINQCVHSGGEGLADIHYTSPTSGGPQTLLRQPEIVHLQDVANLIDLLKILALVVLIAWLAMTFVLWKTGALPRLSQQFKGLATLLVPALLLVFLIGPETVFNGLHELIFPDGHQWFFYYQESLMSTMMLAPVLFGWIAAAMLVISIVLFAAMQYALSLASRTTSRR